MKFPPETKSTLYTHLDESDVLEQLRWVIEPKRMFTLIGGYNKPYHGTIAGPFFQASRNTNGFRRGSLYIKGQVKPESYGSSIDIALDSSPLRLEGILALVLIVVFVSIILFSSKFKEGAQPGENVSSFWIAPIFVLVWYFIEYFGFISEWNNSKKFFLEFFEAQETTDAKHIS